MLNFYDKKHVAPALTTCCGRVGDDQLASKTNQLCAGAFCLIN
jgi:hypothetical protein